MSDSPKAEEKNLEEEAPLNQLLQQIEQENAILKDEIETLFTPGNGEIPEGYWFGLIEQYLPDLFFALSQQSEERDEDKKEIDYKNLFLEKLKQLVNMQVHNQECYEGMEQNFKFITQTRAFIENAKEENPALYNLFFESEKRIKEIEARLAEGVESLIPERLANHQGFMTLLTSRNGNTLAYAGSELQNNREYVSEIVSRCPSAYAYISPSLQKDEALALSIFNNEEGENHWTILHPDLASDPDFALKAMQKNKYVYIYFSKALKEKEELFKLAYKEYPRYLQFSADKFKYDLNYLTDIFERHFSLYIKYDDKQLKLLGEHYNKSPKSLHYFTYNALHLALSLISGLLGPSIGVCLFFYMSSLVLAVTALVMLSCMVGSIFIINKLQSNMAYHWKTFLDHQLNTDEKDKAIAPSISSYLANDKDKAVIKALKNHFSGKKDYYGDKAIGITRDIKFGERKPLIEKVNDPESALYKTLNKKRGLPFTFFGAKHWISSDSASLQIAQKAAEVLPQIKRL